MNLTSKQLKQMIAEEFESVMKEQGAELYRAFNSATMNMLKAGHSARQLIDMVKSHARGRMIQNMSDEERIAMWKKMGIKQEETEPMDESIKDKLTKAAVVGTLGTGAWTVSGAGDDNLKQYRIGGSKGPQVQQELSQAELEAAQLIANASVEELVAIMKKDQRTKARFIKAAIMLKKE